MINQAAGDTRARILTEAMRLFWEKGYGSTSIADVLAAAGANSGSLYHFFPTKQDLLIEVLKMYQAGIGPMLLEPAWEGVTDPIEKIWALLARYRGLLEMTDCFYGCPIGSLALELHEPDPPVRDLLSANFDGWRSAIRTCLEEAARRFPAYTDFDALSAMILTVMEGGVMQSRTYRTLDAYDKSVACLRDYIDLLQDSATRTDVTDEH